MPGKSTEKPFTAIGQRIIAIREALGLNQSEFALRADLKKSQVSNWESGLHRPSLDACIAIRETYGLSIDFIIFGNLDALPHKVAKLLESNPRVKDSK